MANSDAKEPEPQKDSRPVVGTARRNPEDIFDEVGIAVLRIVLKYAWVVAEHAFKLMAWMVGAATLTAYGKRIEDPAITIFGICLSVIWATASAATFFKAAGYIQDAACDKWLRNKERHPLLTIGLSGIITFITVMPMLQLFFFTMKIASTIFAHGGLMP